MDLKQTEYYVHWNGAVWFVKEGEFFKAQGGLEKPWGKAWTPIMATSIEDARMKAPSIFIQKERSMDLNDYQEQAVGTAVYPSAGKGIREGKAYCALKLAGEAGEVAEKIAKYEFRGDLIPGPHPLATYQMMIEKELGDVLWYIAALAREFGLSLSDVAAANLVKLSDRKARGVLKGSGDDR